MTTSTAEYRSPFTPDFGVIPLHMAGRSQEVYEIQHAFASDVRDPNLTSILIGAPGTGKTALLSFLEDRALAEGWIVVDVTSRPNMLENIYEQAEKRSSHLTEQGKDTPQLTGISAGGFGVEWSAANTPSQKTWRTRMEGILDDLTEKRVGLLIGVDEVDPHLDEMTELAACYQHFVREGYKVSLLMAGLSSRILDLLSGKQTSFLRRACQYRLGRIADYEIEQAFESTVIDGGKTITDDALNLAAQLIGGYPFMMQLLGHRCWIASGSNPTITISDIKNGARRAKREINERVYDTMLHELSQGDIDFLVAMLADEKRSSLSDLRNRLSKTSRQLSYQKRRLINQGVIRDGARGFVEFDMPGIREYLEAMEDR